MQKYHLRFIECRALFNYLKRMIDRTVGALAIQAAKSPFRWQRTTTSSTPPRQDGLNGNSFGERVKQQLINKSVNIAIMIFINPQWQGSGFTDELRVGAETFMSYFKDSDTKVIPLSSKGLTTIANIKCFEPLLEQTKLFKEIIIKSKPDKISTMGGDCGIEIMPISYLNKIYQEDMCIVYIDAHADLNTPESSPSKAFHGMPLRTLLGDGNKEFVDLLFSTLKPEQVCYVGLRDLDEPESNYIIKHNITTITDCQFEDVQNKIENFKNIYIHLDLDVLDKSEYEFSMFPTNNGSSVSDVAELVRKIKANYNVVGFCITESTATALEQLDAIKPIVDQIEL